MCLDPVPDLRRDPLGRATGSTAVHAGPGPSSYTTHVRQAPLAEREPSVRRMIPLPRVPRTRDRKTRPALQGSALAALRLGTAQAWTPSNLRGQKVCKQREIERRTPASVSNPVPPGFTRAYRITGPEGETCGSRGCARVQGEVVLPERHAS
jgi:hypothetical protein